MHIENEAEQNQVQLQMQDLNDEADDQNNILPPIVNQSLEQIHPEGVIEEELDLSDDFDQIMPLSEIGSARAYLADRQMSHIQKINAPKANKLVALNEVKGFHQQHKKEQIGDIEEEVKFFESLDNKSMKKSLEKGARLRSPSVIDDLEEKKAEVE